MTFAKKIVFYLNEVSIHALFSWIIKSLTDRNFAF